MLTKISNDLALDINQVHSVYYKRTSHGQYGKFKWYIINFKDRPLEIEVPENEALIVLDLIENAAAATFKSCDENELFVVLPTDVKAEPEPESILFAYNKCF